MNGRVYDAPIGRFMSADPFIQSPMDLQSYNRYAYVRNNPLTVSDPTGHFWWWVVAAIVAPEAGRAVGLWDERTTRIRQGIGLGIVTGGATINWFLAGSGLTVPTVGIAAAGGAVGGFVSGAVITGTLNGAINGAISGALSGALFNAAGMVGGPHGKETFGRYAAHAAAGCVSSAAGGGSCGQGAVSALFGKYTTNQIGSSTLISGDVAKGVATAVAGGVGSMIAGGEFENGAVTAGYGYLFNELGSLFQRGYPHGSGMGSGTHWYDLENRACASSESCTLDSVNAQIRRYPAPSMCSVTPGCDPRPVKTGDTSFAFPVGTVEHQVSNSLVVNNTIGGRHLLHDGTVMRFAIERDGAIYVRSLGFGTGRFPGPNFSQAQSLWGAVDAQIRKQLQGK